MPTNGEKAEAARKQAEATAQWQQDAPKRAAFLEQYQSTVAPLIDKYIAHVRKIAGEKNLGYTVTDGPRYVGGPPQILIQKSFHLGFSPVQHPGQRGGRPNPLTQSKTFGTIHISLSYDGRLHIEVPRGQMPDLVKPIPLDDLTAIEAHLKTKILQFMATMDK